MDVTSVNDLTLQSAYAQATKHILPCVLCGQSQFKVYELPDRHDLGMHFRLCRKCGILSINPRPTSDFFEWFYKEQFWPVYIGDEIESQMALFEMDRPDLKADQIFRRIEKYFDKDQARVLDIGCGLGGLLSVLRQARPTYTTLGVDASRDGCEFVRENGFDVICSPFDELDDRLEGGFDYILSIHVLEHVEDPGKLLETAHSFLDQNGIAYFEVPNLLSPHWKDQGYAFFHLAHLHYFSKNNFMALAEKAGFEVVDVVVGAAQIWSWAVGIVCRKRAEEKSFQVSRRGIRLKWNYLMARRRLLMQRLFGLRG